MGHQFLIATFGEWKKTKKKWEWQEKSVKGVMVDDTISLVDLVKFVTDKHGIDVTRNDVALSYMHGSMNLGLGPLSLESDEDVKVYLEICRNREEPYPLCLSYKGEIPNKLSSKQSNGNTSEIYCNLGVDDALLMTEPDADNDNVTGDVELVEDRYVDNDNENDLEWCLTNDDKEMAYSDPKPNILVNESSSVYQVNSFSCGDSREIEIGQFFTDKSECSNRLRRYAIEKNFEFRVVKSTKTLLIIECAAKACPWRVRAARSGESGLFVIRKLHDEHTCSSSMRENSHRQADAKTIGQMVKARFEGGKQGLTPDQIVDQMLTEKGLKISYNIAWRARKHANDLVRGTPEESYGRLPIVMSMMQQQNPGTVCFIELSDDDRFKYFFFALGPSIRGFTYMRQVIAVDGTFLKGKYKGTLLAATAQDGNFQLYPLAFAIVDSENDASWEWFFTSLRNAIPDSQQLVFISDRHSSIYNGISKVFPSASHGICVYHLQRNIVTTFKTKELLPLVMKAAYAYKKSEFEKFFNEIQLQNEKLADYLKKANPSMWSRAYFPGNRFNIMTTNIAESLNAMLKNAREFPISSLVDVIRATLTRWFHERREKSSKHNLDLTPEADKILKQRAEQAQHLHVLPLSQYEFEVKGGAGDAQVNLENKTCSCCVFDIDKLPCVHAIAAAHYRSIPTIRLVHSVYTTEHWVGAYSEVIRPLPPEDEWVVSPELEDLKCIPPLMRKSSGRPKKKRYPSTGEFSRSRTTKQKHKCSRCNGEGHNQKTCKVPI